MVEYSLALDNVFGALADPTRRDILRRVSLRELSVGELAHPYEMSLAAVSKHLKILEQAKLIMKRRRGKQHLVRLSPAAMREATEYLQWYRQFMEHRLDSLEEYLENSDKEA